MKSNQNKSLLAGAWVVERGQWGTQESFWGAGGSAGGATIGHTRQHLKPVRWSPGHIACGQSLWLLRQRQLGPLRGCLAQWQTPLGAPQGQRLEEQASRILQSNSLKWAQFHGWWVWGSLCGLRTIFFGFLWRFAAFNLIVYFDFLVVKNMLKNPLMIHNWWWNFIKKIFLV